MGDTIAAIGEKLSPAAIAEQAKETVPEIAADVAEHAKEAISEATANATQHAKEAAVEVVEHIKEALPELVSNVAHKAVSGAITEAKDAIGGAVSTAKGAGMTIIERIKQNPVPAAIAGVGLYWLFQSGNGQGETSSASIRPQTNGNAVPRDAGYGVPSYSTSSHEASASAGSKVGEVAGRVQDTASGLADKAQDTVSSVAGAVSDAAGTAVGKVQDAAGAVVDTVQSSATAVAERVQSGAGVVAERVQSSAGAVADRVQSTAHQSSDWLQRNLQTNPLAVGAMALVVGAALGLAIPETEQEDRIMGHARDKVIDKAQEKAGALGDKVQNVAHDAVEAVKHGVSSVEKAAA